MRGFVRPSRLGWRTASIVALTISSLGCASARIRRDNAVALMHADARVLEGCYDCLRDARAVYERLAGAKKNVVPKNAGPISVRLFETELLLALREKELGLDASGSTARARALVPRVPAALEPARVVAMVNAVLPDGRAMALGAHDALIRSHRAYLERIDDDLTWVEQSPLTPAVRKYVALALDCSYFDRRGQDTTALSKRRAVPINAPPLVAYRAANCASSDTLALKRVLAQVPTFVAAAYALGNEVVWASGETGGEDARRYYAQAYERFPRSAGITFMTGWLNLNIGDCVEAARLYDTTLAIVPDHDRAMLQKTICLSTMHEDSAAIATATRFIALSTGDIAQGYYWRAVSRLRRRELVLARGDADSAKLYTSRGSGELLTLAGIIEHEQADYGIAESDLRGARSLPKGIENCNAAFYLGNVVVKREGWPEAVAAYDSAMTCYDDQVNLLEGKIEQVRRSRRGSAAFRAKRIAALESDLADRRKRSRTAAFNAAAMNARLANFDRAEALLVIASQSPDLAGQIERLRSQIAEVSRQRPVPN